MQDVNDVIHKPNASTRIMQRAWHYVLYCVNQTHFDSSMHIAPASSCSYKPGKPRPWGGNGEPDKPLHNEHTSSSFVFGILNATVRNEGPVADVE